MSQQPEVVIGIDLGTTNSCLALVEPDGQPVILENNEGQRTTPSVVAYQPEERLVGNIAKRQMVLNPERTISSSKRLLGRTVDEAQGDPFPQPLAGTPGGGVEIVLPDRQIKPVEVSAAILSKLKSDAEQRLGREINKAVITVPAYFNDPQRVATKQAGEIAGFEVLRIINEPTAAALAYGLGDQDKERTVLVFDLGGGTFDVSVLDIGEGLFEVLGTSGDNHLGGDDFDLVLANWIKDQFQEQSGIDVSADPGAWQRVLEAAESAKRELSLRPETEINIPFLSATADGQPQHVELQITRAQFEELSAELLQRLAVPINEALAGRQVDEVLLVGGMTRMPAVLDKVEKLTGVAPSSGVNPDEVVALGAALQASLLAGQNTEITLIDVIPLALGVETRGGLMTEMFAANTSIPTRRQEIFSTAEDSQESVEIHVVQGQQQIADLNKSLGRFVLSGLPPAPAGVLEIMVSFDIDANGLLQVSAEEKQSGQQRAIEIQGSSDLSAAEVQALSVGEAQQADQQRKKHAHQSSSAAAGQEASPASGQSLPAEHQLPAIEQDRGDSTAPGAGEEKTAAPPSAPAPEEIDLDPRPAADDLDGALQQLQEDIDSIDNQLAK